MTNRGQPTVREDVWIPTVCYMCYNACNIKVHRVDGVVVKIEGNTDSPHNDSRVCAKGNAGLMSLYNPYRIKKPLRRTNPEKGLGVDPRWVEISWEEALDTVVEKLRKVREEDPRKLLISTFDVHAVGYFGHAWASAFGTPNTYSGGAGFFCGNGLHPNGWMYHGAFYLEPDWENARYCLLVGSQAGHGMHLNPMGVGPKVADGRRNGMKVVVVDPVLSQAAAKADEWIPIRPGTDGAFVLGVMNALFNDLGIYDRDFLRRYTNGPYLVGPDGHYVRDGNGKPLVWDTEREHARPFDEEDGGQPALEGSYTVGGVACRPGFQCLKDHIRKYSPEKVAEITTVPVETVRRVAREFGEAASIGSTVVIDGVELPYRPAFVDYSRGAIAHKHAMLTGMACHMMNALIGAIDVPGGYLGLGAAGPTWQPGVGPDGMLVPSSRLAIYGQPFPVPDVTADLNKAELKELFPLAVYSRTMLPAVLLDPEKHKLPYRVEVMLHARNNYIMNTANPEVMAEAFKRIPFIVSFAHTIDESVEFADIVLPDTHYLETLHPFPNLIQSWILAGEGDWYWTIRQPVVKPPPEVRNWVEVLFELADRLGFLGDFYTLLNNFLPIEGEYRLDPHVRYTHEEFIDRWSRSMLGSEYGLEWMKEHGVLRRPKKVQEAFPRPFLKGRVPVYMEHFLTAGEMVERATRELGFDWWDTDDYQAVPDWKPCPSHVDGTREYDLWVVNYKVPYHTFSFTAENGWLDELTDRHPHHRGLIMNPETARRKGIREGDVVWLETAEGRRIKGTVCLTEGIHPEAIGTQGIQGHWAAGRPQARGKGVYFNELIPYDYKYLDFVSAALDSCVKVKVYRAE